MSRTIKCETCGKSFQGPDQRRKHLVGGICPEAVQNLNKNSGIHGGQKEKHVKPLHL